MSRIPYDLFEKHIWVVTTGKNYTTGRLLFISKTKLRAVKVLKEYGYKYNKEQDLWLREDDWCRIQLEDYLK